MMIKGKEVLGFVLTGLLFTSGLQLAAAATDAPPTPAQRAQWRKDHPARAKDNARIRNQKKQLKADLASGKITQAQYDAQMKQLHTIKKEEVVDARANQNGGHLTAGQQQAINQQLNQSHQTIKQDAGTPAPTAVTPPAPVTPPAGQ